MSLESDILKLLSKNNIQYNEILEKLKIKYKGNEIGLIITKLKTENKIKLKNETMFIYSITELGKFELKYIFIKFYLNHWKWVIGITLTLITILTAATIGLLNYFK